MRIPNSNSEMDLSPSTSLMATGFSRFHVFVGTVFLAICLIRNIKSQFLPDRHFGFKAAAWYWHFVDVVWLFCLSPSIFGAEPSASVIRKRYASRSVSLPDIALIAVDGCFVSKEIFAMHLSQMRDRLQCTMRGYLT